jgi:hypothetical protein
MMSWTRAFGGSRVLKSGPEFSIPEEWMDGRVARSWRVPSRRWALSSRTSKVKVRDAFKEPPQYS